MVKYDEELKLEEFHTGLLKFLKEHDIEPGSPMVFTVGEYQLKRMKGFKYAVFDEETGHVTITVRDSKYIFKL